MREKPIQITDTTLRDAHQSLWATRMRTEDMVPILGKLDKVGYHSLEVWGGATFDAPLRFLDENPWDRLRTVKGHVRNTPLQMLLRGQNLVGYKHYSDDIVRKFVRHAVKNGISIFRIFDALNDTRNLEVPIQAVKEAGGHVQASVCYTISPVHTLEHYVETALKLVDMGADSICIKDMAALLSPYRTFNLIKRIKKEINIPIQLHCHYIGGMAPMNYLKAIEAGVDIIDTASAPLAFGNSQPAVEMLVAALKDTAYDTGLELELLYEIAEYWEKVRERRHFQRGVTSLTHMKVFSHQVPGGMISNLYSQLQEQKSADRLPEVLEEIPKVRAEVGYPPLVTPLSQIVGTQAVLNVLSGKRWGVIPDEMKAYVKGYYGRPPGPMAPEIEKKILGNGERITERPGSLIMETFEDYAKEIGNLAKNEEDVLMFALFPKIAREYLERHQEGVEKTVFLTSREIQAVKEDEYMDLEQVKELIKVFEQSDIGELSVEEDGVKINLRKNVSGAAAQEAYISDSLSAKSSTAVESDNTKKKYPSNWKEITTPMVGTFYRAPSPDADAFVEVGDEVKKGQTVCILEAMKLINEIAIEEDGIIREILVENAQSVEYGQPIFLYEPI
ncbi:acetyl-CoA carboxylase biotin carboxyl carrier protein [Candidatus Oleimmundimicrobium sp.]|uniref:acetyl-CoA carboxylase biotin carboxyl carrier protein n=1 Tax=Candidatus Oleimmundimicrobium sp. TaxID=3060597 RepID=UPI00271CD8FE|nr:acetyl-CoA carboxylase biotin carboxyl carrier protein [Candidatus Oleimmundimicrobium sp.]MDO8886516.1 acetyl-CoA carboxylase biotin carboxyl carrier protein [Candidatus Oleimmundimicrobium sp.]